MSMKKKKCSHAKLLTKEGHLYQVCCLVDQNTEGLSKISSSRADDLVGLICGHLGPWELMIFLLLAHMLMADSSWETF
jgi:hypothetical protein